MPSSKGERPTQVVVLSAVLAGLMGCGWQQTIEKKIYRVATARGVNYYRVRVDSVGYNSVSKYKTGLFPAFAVDQYLGSEAALPADVTSAEAGLRKTLINAQQDAYTAYVTAVANGDLEGQTRATGRLRQLQQVPVVTGATPGFEQVQPNPIRSLVNYAEGKKFVIAFSSNPDAVMQSIAALAEEPATSEAIIEGFSGLILAGSASGARGSAQGVERAKDVGAALSKLAGEKAESAADVQAKLTQAARLLEVLP